MDATNYKRPALSSQLAFDLKHVFAEKEFDEIAFRLYLESFMPESLWLGTDHRVFLEFPAGYYTTSSATLLRPTLYSFSGRLDPGFCPYYPSDDAAIDTLTSPTTRELLEKDLVQRQGIVSELIKAGIADFDPINPTNMVAQRIPLKAIGHKGKAQDNDPNLYTFTKLKNDTNITVEQARNLFKKAPFGTDWLPLRTSSVRLVVVLCIGIAGAIIFGCVIHISFTVYGQKVIKEKVDRREAADKTAALITRSNSQSESHRSHTETFVTPNQFHDLESLFSVRHPLEPCAAYVSCA